MSQKPYIVYIDPDTAFGEEVLMYADNAPLVTCDMCAKFDTRHCPMKVPSSFGHFCSEAVDAVVHEDECHYCGALMQHGNFCSECGKELRGDVK